MKPSLTTTVEERPVAELEPALKERIHALLSTYSTITVDLELLTEQQAEIKKELGELLDLEGIASVKAPDYSLSWVRGAVSTTLDKQKLHALGVTMAQIEAATVTKPKKAYFVVRSTARKLTGAGSDE